VLERIGDVAYKLRLPAGARLNNVFHVSLMKPFHGDLPYSTPPLPLLDHGRVVPQPAAIVRAQVCRGIREILVQWVDLSAEEASWVCQYNGLNFAELSIISARGRAASQGGERCHVGGHSVSLTISAAGAHCQRRDFLNLFSFGLLEISLLLC
jgi:hypothetical protein